MSIVVNSMVQSKDYTLKRSERKAQIISRELWAELKAKVTDLTPLQLPVERGVIAHHTGNADNRCFTISKISYFQRLESVVDKLLI